MKREYILNHNFWDTALSCLDKKDLIAWANFYKISTEKKSRSRLAKELSNKISPYERIKLIVGFDDGE